MYHVIKDVNNCLYRGGAEISIDADLVSITPFLSVTAHFTTGRYWANVLLYQ